MTLSAAEQYLLELINRARLDPSAEALRQGVSLTSGGVSISTSAKQVLAPSAALETAAENHTAYMFQADIFTHSSANGDRAIDRAADLGYYGRVGENLSWLGITGSDEAWVKRHFDNLWASPNHRPNTMQDAFREIGLEVANGIGGFQAAPNSPASLVTEVFGARSAVFVTGVAYADRNGNDFYNMGEGQSGIRVMNGRTLDTSEAAGGYGIQVAQGAAVPISITVGTRTVTLTVDTRDGNVKVDVINGSRLDVSGSFDLTSGGMAVKMLGVAALDGLGSDVGDSIWGNKAGNLINGEDGWDKLWGGYGQDMLQGGTGDDQLFGGDGNDRLLGEDGNDVLAGGDGGDRIVGGRGNDRMTGGTGADNFAFGGTFGRDLITDLSARAGDQLLLDDALWTGRRSASDVVEDFARYSRSGNVILDFGDAGEIELRGITSTSGLAGLIDII